jgi:hypothetical protein
MPSSSGYAIRGNFQNWLHKLILHLINTSIFFVDGIALNSHAGLPFDLLHLPSSGWIEGSNLNFSSELL